MLSRKQEKRRRCLEAIQGGIEHWAVENADWDGVRDDLCRAFPSESEDDEDSTHGSMQAKGEDSHRGEDSSQNKRGARKRTSEVISLLLGSNDADEPSDTEPQYSRRRSVAEPPPALAVGPDLSGHTEQEANGDSLSKDSENSESVGIPSLSNSSGGHEQSFDNKLHESNTSRDESSDNKSSGSESSDSGKSDIDPSDDSSTDNDASSEDKVMPDNDSGAPKRLIPGIALLQGDPVAAHRTGSMLISQNGEDDCPFPSIEDGSIRAGDSGPSDDETGDDDEYNIDGLDLDEEEGEEIVKRFRTRVRVVDAAQTSSSEWTTREDTTEPAKEVQSIASNGFIYQVGRTYHFLARDRGMYLYGIERLYLRRDGKSYTECVQVLRLEETFLGIQSTHYPYVRFAEKDKFPLDDRFRQEAEDVDGIPLLKYEDYRGKGLHVCYYPPMSTEQLLTPPLERPTLVDLFAGAGGMHHGFRATGFETTIAIEKNPFAAWTLSGVTNNIFTGDVTAFLEMCRFPSFRTQLGSIWHLHLSPPCQGFSTANRHGGRNNKANNELSLKFLDAVRLLKPYTATYEIVTGILREAHRNYLERIMLGLIEEGYQARCTILNARDYGDPQNRRRLIIFAARAGIELPRRPRATHGEPPLLRAMTVEDAIGDLPTPPSPKTCEMEHRQRTLYNTWYPTTKAVPGDPDTVVLEPHQPASTIRASTRPPFYYAPIETEEGNLKYRCISVREAALLQSFPRHNKFWGPPKQQRIQVGNAVPVRLATAIARSVRDVFDSVT